MTTQTLPATHWRKDASLIGLVGLAHSVSHFSQLLLAPLFPWLKDAFAVSYTELGFLLTILFVVSCAVQNLVRVLGRPLRPAADPVCRPGAAGRCCGWLCAASTSYWMLAAFSIVAGTGNGVFHPVNYSLLNHKVAKERLGHAYSVHGITGSLAGRWRRCCWCPSPSPRHGAWRCCARRRWLSRSLPCCGSSAMS